jgi:7,8-dihydro-6-hydroxymethylpterin-pyrophosphokinase
VLGRVRTENKYAPRTIDLDILVVDGAVCEPQIWSQAFLAIPLSELLPDYLEPETGETLSQVSTRLKRETGKDVHTVWLPNWSDSGTATGKLSIT